jgi:hypothetical protein
MDAMRTVFTLNLAGLDWQRFVALVERHKLDRLVDIRAIGDARHGRFCHAILERGLPALYERWANLSPCEAFEQNTVRRDLRELLNTSDGARICFLYTQDGFHLTPLCRRLGWHVFRISHSGQLVTDPGPVEAPDAAMRRAPGASSTTV